MAERVYSPALFGAKGDPEREIGGPASKTPKDDQETIREVYKGYEQARDYKHTQVPPEHWRRYFLIYNDRHWDGSQQYWQSTPTINLSFAAINAILPIITDSRPEMAVMPREPDDSKTADILRALLEWLWEKNVCDELLPNTMLNSMIFGNGFWKIIWDPDAEQGLGDIRIVNVDPTRIFFNAEATRLEDAEELYHVEQMAVTKLRRLYPDKADAIKPSVMDASILIDRPHMSQMRGSSAPTLDVQTTTGSQVTTYPAGSAGKQDAESKTSATVIERWSIDPETSRWKVQIITKDAVLKDEVTDEKMLPFAHFVDYSVPWTVWGTGEIQHVENLQYEINKRRGMILDILRFTAHPMLVVDPASGVDIDTIQARPGLVIPAEGGLSSVGWLAPNFNVAGLFAVNDRDKQDFNDILGNVDVVQGKRPVGVEAASAIELLSETANTRIRLKVRHMEAAIRRASQIMVGLIQRHYTTRRMFRVVGNEFLPSGESGMPGTQSFFSINEPTGQIGPDGEPELENPIPEDAEFDVKIGAGSTLPMSRTARFQQAITLFDRRIVDRQEVLKHSAWPRWEEVDARIAEKEQAMAASAQAGQAMPAEEEIPENIEQLLGIQPQEEAPSISEEEE